MAFAAKKKMEDASIERIARSGENLANEIVEVCKQQKDLNFHFLRIFIPSNNIIHSNKWQNTYKETLG